MEKGDYTRVVGARAGPVDPAIAQSPEGLFVLVTDLLNTGDRTAAARFGQGMDDDSPDVPPEWSIKFAVLLVDEKRGSPTAIAVLERAQLGSVHRPSSWRSTSPVPIW